ncbi:hypothetical protein BDW02DRAFT_620255 [Decorospora gaudefroyi]|uniref:Uncharacterized protein n=1 Tax=Decorospora gaudefroyi TaxID=184978 RepID=A0A6A5KYR2_9PLEO|nr:hypothetical protein BDW02DRAFT_620255 [Decorospora gaudefroyi]
MPILPNLAPRNEVSLLLASPPVQSTTPTHRDEFIAGAILGMLGLTLFVIWLRKTGIPWYKRVRESRAERKNAVMDLEAALSTSRLPSPALGHSAPTTSVDARIHSRNQATPPQSTGDPVGPTESNRALEPSIHDPTSSSSSLRTDRTSTTGSISPDLETFPAFDPDYRPSFDIADVPLHSVRHSHVSDDTVESTDTGTSMGTTLSVGEAVPVRMTSYNIRHGS